MSLTEETTSTANNANNSFHININTEKPLPGIAQSVQQPMQQPMQQPIQQPMQQPMQQPYPTQYPPTQYPQYVPYQPPANINTVNPVFNINANAPTTGYVCPHCNSNLTPVTNHTPGIASYITGALLCFAFCPLFWLPCVSKSCMDEKDVCRNCNREQRERKKPWTCYAVLLGLAFAGTITIIVISTTSRSRY